ncbi:MAG: hypothetical protein FJ102_00335 [Deltaproteobacteria bacterium]|nr:hypothetical protein [Deltaproteobacteria bacterium]
MLLFSLALAAEPVIDTTRLVVLAPAEITAMGGAGLGFARGANGTFFNPAAPVNRRIEQTRTWGVSLAFTQLALGPEKATDVANLGEVGPKTGGMANLGVAGFWRNFGGGLVYSGLEYRFGSALINVTEGHLAAGGSYDDGKVAVALGARALAVHGERDGNTLDWTGQGGEVGVLASRLWDGWNLGGTFRSEVRAVPTEGGSPYPIEAAVMPWHLALGVGWTDAEHAPPRPVRVAGDLTIDGAVEDGYALETALEGEGVRRGKNLTVTPHLGFEVEAVPRRLRVRAGSYFEPTRTALASGRLHGTTGLEVRLFRLKLFKGVIDTEISWEAAVDASRGYLNLAYLGIGSWDSGLTGGQWAED